MWEKTDLKMHLKVRVGDLKLNVKGEAKIQKTELQQLQPVNPAVKKHDRRKSSTEILRLLISLKVKYESKYVSSSKSLVRRWLLKYVAELQLKGHSRLSVCCLEFKTIEM